MARRRKKSTIPNQYLKYCIIGVVVLFVLFVFYNKVIFFLKHSKMFEVKDVVISTSLKYLKSRHLSGLKGKNIFSIDLKTVQRRVQSQYPDIDQLRIIRKLPDKIFVLAKKREPFVYISVEESDLVLDQECVVLSNRKSPALKLPYIKGIFKNRNVVLGRSFGSSDVKLAVKIIKYVQENEYLSATKVVSIDVSNLSKIYLYLSNGVKIIMDKDRIERKVRNLGILFAEGNINFKDYDYIDLRFKEPILGKK